MTGPIIRCSVTITEGTHASARRIFTQRSRAIVNRSTAISDCHISSICAGHRTGPIIGCGVTITDGTYASARRIFTQRPRAGTGRSVVIFCCQISSICTGDIAPHGTGTTRCSVRSERRNRSARGGTVAARRSGTSVGKSVVIPGCLSSSVSTRSIASYRTALDIVSSSAANCGCLGRSNCTRFSCGAGPSAGCRTTTHGRWNSSASARSVVGCRSWTSVGRCIFTSGCLRSCTCSTSIASCLTGLRVGSGTAT